MDMRSNLRDITHLDLVTLRHLADAQHNDSPVPPAFTDTLFRLAKRGFITAGQARAFMVTPKGENFLRASVQTGPGLPR